MDVVNGRIINYSIKIKVIKNITKFDIFENKLYHKVWKLFNKQLESRELMSILYIEFLILTARCKANILSFSEASQKAVIISDEYGIPTVYTISDINWGEGIERKQIENILKEAVRQAFDYKLCERVANQTIDILAGNVGEPEWE